MRSRRKRTLKVGIGGLGAIGLPVARWLASKPPGLRLAAVSARDRARAAKRLAAAGIKAPVRGLDELAKSCDVVVECLPSAAFDALVVPAVRLGRIVIVLSLWVALSHEESLPSLRGSNQWNANREKLNGVVQLICGV